MKTAERPRISEHLPPVGLAPESFGQIAERPSAFRLVRAAGMLLALLLVAAWFVWRVTGPERYGKDWDRSGMDAGRTVRAGE